MSVCPRIGDLPPIYGKVCGETWSTYIRNQGLFGPFGYPMFVYKPSKRRSNLAVMFHSVWDPLPNLCILCCKKLCDESHIYYPYAQCMVYLPTFGCFFGANVGKYSIHGAYLLWTCHINEGSRSQDRTTLFDTWSKDKHDQETVNWCKLCNQFMQTNTNLTHRLTWQWFWISWTHSFMLSIDMQWFEIKHRRSVILMADLTLQHTIYILQCWL